MLAGARVAYELQRSQRRSIGFSVAAGALSVRAPKWLSLADIDQAVHTKSRWIVQKLQQTQARQPPVQGGTSSPWAWGQTLAYLGQALVLAPAQALAGKPGSAWLDGPSSTLHLSVPMEAPPAQFQLAAQQWLQQQARQHFNQRLDFFAAQLGVSHTSLALSNARTRWGSASAGGAIRLNWRLIQLEPCLVDYVVVHELSHLRHMNHSAQFWACVQSVLPDMQLLRRQLRQKGAASQ